MIELAIQELNHAMNATRKALGDAEQDGRKRSIRRLEAAMKRMHGALCQLYDERDDLKRLKGKE
jgi:hypothetical protein